jgi:hypothetical protein
MTDPKKTEPDQDLLEFLGDIDQANDESQDDDFSGFLAKNDIDPMAGKDPKKAAPPKDAKRE